MTFSPRSPMETAQHPAGTNELRIVKSHAYAADGRSYVVGEWQALDRHLQPETFMLLASWPDGQREVSVVRYDETRGRWEPCETRGTPIIAMAESICTLSHVPETL